jgi:hypothetical protein
MGRLAIDGFIVGCLLVVNSVGGPTVNRFADRAGQHTGYVPEWQVRIRKNLKKALTAPNPVKTFRLPFVAGWSSLVARQAHNLKVAGSNPAPAPNLKPPETLRGFLVE